MISYIQIGYISALLQHGNFQRAADACHVTQPTLSMQIKKAEDAVGYKIIDRDTSPLSLTHAGKQLYVAFSAIEDAYKELDVQVQKLEGTYQSEIRLAIIPTISNYLVPDLFSKWQDRIGKVHLDITELATTKMIDAVKNKEIDYGIMAGPLHDPNLEKQLLFNEPIFVYAPEIKGKNISMEQLENKHPWLLKPGNCLRTQMINFCQLNKEEKSEWNYEGSNLNLLIEMVKQEGGYTLLPERSIPHLAIHKKDIKKVQGPQPYRQIIGVSLRRNSKKAEMEQITRVIKGSQTKNTILGRNAALLPWDA